MTFDALVCVWRTILCQWDQESSIIDQAVDQAHRLLTQGGADTITDQAVDQAQALASHHGRPGSQIRSGGD